MQYRIYYLDADRHLHRAKDFHCSSDGEAKLRFLDINTAGFAAELWEKGRLIACLPQKGCERCPHDPAKCRPAIAYRPLHNRCNNVAFSAD